MNKIIRVVGIIIGLVMTLTLNCRAFSADANGIWEGTVAVDNAPIYILTLVLHQDGGSVSGLYTENIGGAGEVVGDFVEFPEGNLVLMDSHGGGTLWEVRILPDNSGMVITRDDEHGIGNLDRR